MAKKSKKEKGSSRRRKTSRDHRKRTRSPSSSSSSSSSASFRNSSPETAKRKHRSDSIDFSAFPPLDSLVCDRPALVRQALAVLQPELHLLLPDSLKGKSAVEVERRVLDDVEGMSKKRLAAIIEGVDLESSSSSDSSSGDESEHSRSGSSSPERLDRVSVSRASPDSSGSGGEKFDIANAKMTITIHRSPSPLISSTKAEAKKEREEEEEEESAPVEEETFSDVELVDDPAILEKIKETDQGKEEKEDTIEEGECSD